MKKPPPEGEDSLRLIRSYPACTPAIPIIPSPTIKTTITKSICVLISATPYATTDIRNPERILAILQSLWKGKVEFT